MKITIIGAGAIGSLLAARLARSGCDVTLLVRDDGTALRSDIQLIDDAGDQAVPVRFENQPAKLGVQNLVILALKAHAIAGAMPQIIPLLDRDTNILSAVNGVPWWFFEGHDLVPSQTAPTQIELASVDPGGQICASLRQQPLVGCVLFPAATMISPGTVRHLSGNRIVFGNPRLSDDQAAVVAGLFSKAGFEAAVAPDIRAALWAKLVGNAAVNPLSVITGGTIKHIAQDPNLSAILTSAMAEIDAVGASIGIAPMMTQDQRLALAASVGHHKTSMLQDFEAGRVLEISPLLGAVREIGLSRGVDTQVLDIFHHLVAAKCSAPVSPV